LGGLVLAADGSYTYSVANSAVQFLAGSDANGGTSTHVDTFTVTSADHTTEHQTQTNHVTNHPAEIDTPTVAAVTEDTPDSSAATLPATATLAISDTAAGEGHSLSLHDALPIYLGGLVLAADGSYTYSVANSAVQFLAGSDANGGTSTHVDTFTVTAEIGRASCRERANHGTNDAAVIGTPTVAAVTGEAADSTEAPI